MRLKILGLILAVCVFACAARADTATPLRDPSPNDLAFLGYQLTKTDIPFDDWAAADARVKQLNEFQQPSAAKALADQFRARAHSLEGTTDLIVPMNSQFGEYNTQYNEFDMQMDDGTFILFNTSFFSNRVEIALTNGGLAQSWSVSPQEGDKILKVTHGNRGVVLDMRLKITGASMPLAPQDPLVLNATIVEYDIRESLNGTRLGHVIVH